jgi:hypothetical protein
MKAIFFFLLTIISFHSFAQLEKGFQKEEARDMIAVCNSFSFLELYDSDSLILPHGYKKRYTSPVLGMDNIYQVYTNNRTAVINFRGSTAEKISWLENIYSAMIPAKGKIEIAGNDFKYCFAKNKNAAVHAGYSLEVAFLSKDIIQQVKILNKEGIHSFIITGHSQGGALANMMRAYLENLPWWKIRKRNKFKTYAFAAPMVGNKEFSEEYNNRYSLCKTSFNIVNLSDPIPNFPLSYCDSNYVLNNLKTFLFDNESFSLTKMMTDGVAIIMEKSANLLSGSVSKQIAKELGPFSMPTYVSENKYYSLNNRVEIAPSDFPKILKDSSRIKNKILMTFSKKDEEGNYSNKLLYAKESWSFQHKPYSYYTTILKMHFPNEYDLIKNKFSNKAAK